MNGVLHQVQSEDLDRDVDDAQCVGGSELLVNGSVVTKGLELGMATRRIRGSHAFDWGGRSFRAGDKMSECKCHVRTWPEMPKFVQDAHTGEVITIDSRTGGRKGAKPERFDLLPWQSIAAISRVYSYGAIKYSERNWQRGYAWSLSYAALMRHLAAWWEGESKDPESGLSHLAHAGFHVLSLLWYEIKGKGTDDRYRGEANG